MAYPPRKLSEGNVYHVITRGVGQQIIFEDNRDRTVFVDDLRERADKMGIGIWAWCLMSNHVHILLHGPIEDISLFVQQLKSKYALYFNRRHARTGTLFQGRYTSVPISSDEQLVAAVEYIHLNPVRAGATLAYKWSSYRDYFNREEIAEDGKKLVGSLMGGSDGFERAHKAFDPKDLNLSRRGLSEAEMLTIAKAVLGNVDIYDVKALPKPERDECIVRLRSSGLSVRQIARLTGIGQNIIVRA